MTATLSLEPDVTGFLKYGSPLIRIVGAACLIGDASPGVVESAGTVTAHVVVDNGCEPGVTFIIAGLQIGFLERVAGGGIDDGFGR